VEHDADPYVYEHLERRPLSYKGLDFDFHLRGCVHNASSAIGPLRSLDEGGESWLQSIIEQNGRQNEMRRGVSNYYGLAGILVDQESKSVDPDEVSFDGDKVSITYSDSRDFGVWRDIFD
jgi:hypothetical protein